MAPLLWCLPVPEAFSQTGVPGELFFLKKLPRFPPNQGWCPRGICRVTHTRRCVTAQHVRQSREMEMWPSHTSQDTEYKKLERISAAHFSEKNLSSLFLFLPAPAEPHLDLQGPKPTVTHEHVLQGQPFHVTVKRLTGNILKAEISLNWVPQCLSEVDVWRCLIYYQCTHLD